MSHCSLACSCKLLAVADVSSDSSLKISTIILDVLMDESFSDVLIWLICHLAHVYGVFAKQGHYIVQKHKICGNESRCTVRL